MKKILIGIVGVAIVAFLWWTISPLFINVEVQDELDPELQAILDSAGQAIEDTAAAPATETPTNPATEAAVTEEVVVATDGPAPTAPAPTDPAPLPPENPAVTSGPATETSSPAPGTTPGPVVRGPFAITDTPTHPASGAIRIIENATENGESIIRFEDYDGTNGPDLRIYLATDLDATEFVDLGTTRGNMGNINYTVPADIDLDDYQYVMTWCRAFGVLFDYAQIN